MTPKTIRGWSGYRNDTRESSMYPVVLISLIFGTYLAILVSYAV